MGYAVEAIGLGKMSSRRWLIRDVNLAISRSSVYYLVGPNGSGKTTLLRLLAGLARASSGTVRVLGHEIWGASSDVRSQIGFVPADGGYYANLTVDQNLKVAAALRRRDGRYAVDEAATTLELSSVRERRAGTLSKGQKKRLAIACGLVGYPQVLFLDEPCANLDTGGFHLIQGLIAMVCAEHGTTVVVASTLPPSGLSHSALVGVIGQGRLCDERAMAKGLNEAEGTLMLGQTRATSLEEATDEPDQD
jgi:ABC-type multidrug transport system ATPase subunit